ncbi:glycosyltransferase [Phycicoccus avicenniae]|uniref:glycosyltransferase n=1 Tax=Phycicoccus avicenniae TaxID=2828860 RepID=UPI003D2AA9CA
MSTARFHVDAAGQWSGGGGAVIANLAFAAASDDVLTTTPGPATVPLVPRNVPSSRSALLHPFVWMPQNALPWGPPSLEERSLQRTLRLASTLVAARARALVRISGAIPPLPRRRPTSEVLHNVLDTGFEEVLPEAAAPGNHFVSIGSAHGYRHLVPLARGYAEYRRRGGRTGLTIVTSAGSPAVDGSLADLAATVEGLTHHGGGVDRPGALRAMARSRGVLLPSSVEASPMTLLEARALGRPVACSRIRAHDELLDGEPMPRFDSSDPRSVAGALEALDEYDGRAPHALEDAATRDARRAEWAARLTGFLHGLG